MINQHVEEQTVTRFVSTIFSLLVVLSMVAPAAYAAEEKSKKELEEIQEEKQGIRKMRDEVLRDLYKEKPSVEGEVKKAAAVAAFSSLGINVLFLSTARGGGVVREASSGKETFMRMLSLGAGIGLGVKDFRVVFVFHTKQAYNNFVNSGWDFSGQADAAAKSGDKGGSGDAAATLVDGVSIYQLTENGLALQATLQGTKYYKDDDLNNQ